MFHCCTRASRLAQAVQRRQPSHVARGLPLLELWRIRRRRHTCDVACCHPRTLRPEHPLTVCCRVRAQLVANAGDSRAVLCRGGKAVTLSTDHKPAAPAERARILHAGGAVCHEGRLNGELTVARSIGAPDSGGRC